MLWQDQNHERAYECGTCGRSVTYVGGLPALYPFCSERCRLVDLGKWFREEYSVERDLAPDDLPPDGPRCD